MSPEVVSRNSDTPRATTFFGLQALRALAAVMVVVHHATQLWVTKVYGPDSTRWWENGASGVDIFFVISGFVMAISTIGREHKTHPARSFMERRIVRIVPLYWIVTALVVVKLMAENLHPQFRNGGAHEDLSVPYVLASLFFIPYRNSLGHVQPVLSVGWTLMFEMFFYLLFAAALAARRNVALWLTIVLLPLAVVGSFATPSWPSFMVLASPRLLEFLGGVLLAYGVLKGLRMNTMVAAVLGLVSLPVLLFVPVERPGFLLGCALPAFLIVQAVVLLEHRIGAHWPRWMLYLGDASYSLYLSHGLIFAVVVRYLVKMPFMVPGAVRVLDEAAVVVLLLPACVAGAVVLYRFVEKPMTDTLRVRLLHERRPEARAVS